MKPLLRYFLPNADVGSSALAESEVSANEASPEKNNNKLQARSNHQRLVAFEIFSSMVKSSAKNEDLLKALQSQILLISDVLCTVVKTSDSWQQKKVKKTMQALGVFTKLGKTATTSTHKAASFNKDFEKAAVQLIKAIEDECKKDASMSNLKGKIKEIKEIITVA